MRPQASHQDARELGVFPEAIQYLLLNYAKDAVIEDALMDLRDISQKPGENEADYATRHSEAELRIGNVYPWEERKLRYINGLNPVIKALVTRYNREKRKATYWDVVEFAISEGDAYRARNKRGDPLLPTRPSLRGTRDNLSRGVVATPRPTSRRVYLLQESDSKTETRMGTDATEGVFLMEGDSLSIPVTDSYTTDTVETIDATNAENKQDSVLLADARGRNYRRPAPIAYQDRNTTNNRPGWIDNNALHTGRTHQGEQRPQRRSIVCHICYQPGHISPDCLVDVSQNPDLIARNYHALSRDILREVPASSYWTARDILDARQTGAGPSAIPPQQSEAHPRAIPDDNRQDGEGKD